MSRSYLFLELGASEWWLDQGMFGLMSFSQQILGVAEDTKGDEAHSKMSLDVFIIPLISAVKTFCEKLLIA